MRGASGAQCRNGTERTNNRLRLKIPHNDQRGLAFVIGVPESLNHANPVEALPPLGFTDMHWHWRSGYKFMRVGIDARDGRRWIHIGSSRCAGTISDPQGCRNSNRSNVRLPGFVPGRHGVVIDIGSFFDTTAAPVTCTSGPSELACVRPFQQLGIDFDSGVSVSPAAVFALVELE